MMTENSFQPRAIDLGNNKRTIDDLREDRILDALSCFRQDIIDEIMQLRQLFVDSFEQINSSRTDDFVVKHNDEETTSTIMEMTSQSNSNRIPSSIVKQANFMERNSFNVSEHGTEVLTKDEVDFVKKNFSSSDIRNVVYIMDCEHLPTQQSGDSESERQNLEVADMQTDPLEETVSIGEKLTASSVKTNAFIHGLNLSVNQQLKIKDASRRRQLPFVSVHDSKPLDAAAHENLNLLICGGGRTTNNRDEQNFLHVNNETEEEKTTASLLDTDLFVNVEDPPKNETLFETPSLSRPTEPFNRDKLRDVAATSPTDFGVQMFSSSENLYSSGNMQELQDTSHPTNLNNEEDFLVEDSASFAHFHKVWVQHETKKSKLPKRSNIFKCSYCYKSFDDQALLERHTITHTEGKAFQCDVCNKRFARKDILKSHMKVHTGEKSFKCETCERCFTRKSDLTIHTRLHTGERPFKCNFCNKYFISSSKLRQHEKGRQHQRSFSFQPA